MNRRTRIKLYAVLCLTGLFALAAQEMDFGPTINLHRDIVILNDGVTDEEMLVMLQDFLHRRFSLPVRVEQNPVALPAPARPRKPQWDLKQLLEAVICRVRGEGRCLLLTSKDTYTQTMNWSTGIARCNGTTAVVSACRLNPSFWGDAYDRAWHYKRVRKIVLHELGHTFGQSDHCGDWACAIHGSGSIGEIDQTGEDYCPRCKALANAAIVVIHGETSVTR